MADIDFAEAAGFRLGPLLPEGAQVRQIKIALTRLGFYFPDPGKGIDEEVDAQFKDELHAYQRKSAMQLGDTDFGPGSTTERILNRDLEAVDVNTIYVWRTAGDEKVRAGHAAKEGMRFCWSDFPDGEHPVRITIAAAGPSRW